MCIFNFQNRFAFGGVEKAQQSKVATICRINEQLVFMGILKGDYNL